MIQGGDITTGDGSGGQSIFGGHFRGESRFLMAKGVLTYRHRREFCPQT